MEAAFARDILGVTSPALLAEFQRVLSLSAIRRLTQPPLEDDIILRSVEHVARHFYVTDGAFRDVDKVPLDFKDNPLVEAALEAEAELIVSDDHDLLSLKFVRIPGFRIIEITPPSVVLRRIAGQ